MSLASNVLLALGDPVIAVDRGGEVVVWTPSAERLLGYSAEDAVGRTLPEFGIRLDTLLAGRERRLTLRRRDGGTFPATVTATPLLGAEGGRQGVVLLVKDLTPWIGPAGDDAASTETQAVEERLGAAFRGIVEATGTDFTRGGRVEGLAQTLAEHGRRLLPGISCLLVVVPATRQEVFYCQAGAGQLAETLVGQSFPRSSTVVGAALAQSQVIERTDMQVASGRADLLVAAGINTMRAVPMSTQKPLPDGRRALGATVYYRAEPRPFTASERRLLDDFAALVGLSLQQAELRATTQRAMARLQLAVDVSLDLARSLDVREVVRRLVRRAAVATRADRCDLLLLEGDEEGDFITVDSYDAMRYDRSVGYRLPIDSQSMLREAVSSRAPVLAGPLDMSSMPADRRWALAGVRHTAAVPLVYAGEVIAVLVLSRRRDQQFGPEEVDTLMLLGGPAALALRNSYLYARTEEASRVKTDFLDMAAHELRTPLTVISGYLSILREGAFGPAPSPWGEPLRILDAKANELRRLVDDLLLAARLETERLEAAHELVDLREVVEQMAQAAEVAPELVLPEDAVMVRGDREQLSRLLDHLVTNALAYGREGIAPWARVELDVRPEVGEAKLMVEDRGRGVGADGAERIFERFSRLEDPDHPMVPGTGLGLYIARELAVRHHGRLELEWSEPGVGSRFAAYLPLLEGPTQPEAEEDADAEINA
jgi:PAS domain S-box-containing protein